MNPVAHMGEDMDNYVIADVSRLSLESVAVDDGLSESLPRFMAFPISGSLYHSCSLEPIEFISHE
jgi:hypothetical protein